MPSHIVIAQPTPRQRNIARATAPNILRQPRAPKPKYVPKPTVYKFIYPEKSKSRTDSRDERRAELTNKLNKDVRNVQETIESNEIKDTNEGNGDIAIVAKTLSQMADIVSAKITQQKQMETMASASKQIRHLDSKSKPGILVHSDKHRPGGHILEVGHSGPRDGQAGDILLPNPEYGYPLHIHPEPDRIFQEKIPTDSIGEAVKSESAKSVLSVERESRALVQELCAVVENVLQQEEQKRLQEAQKNIEMSQIDQKSCATSRVIATEKMIVPKVKEKIISLQTDSEKMMFSQLKEKIIAPQYSAEIISPENEDDDIEFMEDIPDDASENSNDEKFDPQSVSGQEFRLEEPQEETVFIVKHKKPRKRVHSKMSGESGGLIRAPNIHKSKEGGAVHLVPVGIELKEFLKNHELFQRIYLNRGKRDIKKKLVTVSRQPWAVDTGSWKRGSKCHERNRLDDMFSLTPEGERKSALIAERRCRDEYVVNWYLWCPGHGNCVRKCGGAGVCRPGE